MIRPGARAGVYRVRPDAQRNFITSTGVKALDPRWRLWKNLVHHYIRVVG